MTTALPVTVYGLVLSTVAHVPVDTLPDPLLRRMRGAAELLAVADALELPPGSPAARRLAGLLELDGDDRLTATMLREAAAGTPPEGPLARAVRLLAGACTILETVEAVLRGLAHDPGTLERAVADVTVAPFAPADLARLWRPGG